MCPRCNLRQITYSQSTAWSLPHIRQKKCTSLALFSPQAIRSVQDVPQERMPTTQVQCVVLMVIRRIVVDDGHMNIKKLRSDVFS